MDVTAHRRAHAGELVAYDLPSGPHWRAILEAHAETGASFLPVDARLSDREKRALVAQARPTVLVTSVEEVVVPAGGVVDPDRAWAVVATSGTAGATHLADLPRAAIGSAVAGSLDALAIDASEPWLCVLTPAHVGGLLVLLRGVLGGADVTVHERFDVEGVLRDGRGRHVALVPTMVHRLVEADADLSSLGTLLVGGSALDPALRRRADDLGARIVSTYGLTETCGGVVYDGRAFDGTHLRVTQDGLIEMRGPTLMDGYRHEPQPTAAAFTTDGWLRTGDVGRVEDGLLTVLGRADDAIRTGSETVWPDEVESVLRAHPGVADVAVAGRLDPEWGQRIEAWIVPADPTYPPTLQALRDHCRDHVAGFKAPRAVHVTDRLPRTAGGKLRRSSLR